MTNEINFMTVILYVMLGIMFVLAIALAFVYMNMKVKEKQSIAIPYYNSVLTVGKTYGKF